MKNSKVDNCGNCRWWSLACRYTSTKTGHCSLITSGGGDRDRARLFPVNSGAFLSTPESFSCNLHETKEPKAA